MGCRQGPLGQEDIAQEDLVQDVETAQEMVVSEYEAVLGPLMSFVGLSLQAVDLEDLEDTTYRTLRHRHTAGMRVR